MTEDNKPDMLAFFGTLTGTDPTGRGNADEQAIKTAVAERFVQIRDKLVRNPEGYDGGHLYDDNRCKPENLGWRLLQNCRIGFSAKKGTIVTVEKIREGLLDAEIEATWHESARAEHWYRFEKDWG